jgi:lysyl-tRNA synthetase class 2
LLSYRDAFDRYVDVDPHTADSVQLAEAARRLDVDALPNTDDKDRDAWLDLLLVERVQPRLGQERPTILFDYPASQAALAQVRNEQTPVAERFELFVSGVELANGYHELLDPQVLSSRNETANQQRRQDGKEPLPEDSRLLAAMNAGVPPCSGTALGFDRLVMLATGSLDISDVLTFPIELA